MAGEPIPNVVAMLVCDQIITEEQTHKKSLVGIFDSFVSLTYPTALQRLAIYVKLADAVGSYQLKFRLVNLKNESLVMEIGAEVKIADISQYSEIGINLSNIPFPELGKYEMQLYAGDIYLHRVMMSAGQASAEGGLPWQQPKL
jgi:hypothetical protein